MTTRAKGAGLHEARFQDLVEGSLQGIVIHRGWTPLFANQAYAALFGYESADALLATGSIQQLFASHEVERMKRYRQERLGGGSPPTRFEVEGRRMDGSTVWTENLVRLIELDGEQVIQCTAVDISDRKRTEEELRAAKAEAERRALEAEQAQAELLRKERLATLGRLTSTVSHELRTPLGTIKASLDTARARLGEDVDTKVLRTLVRAERNLQRCVDIIENLLNYARTQELQLVPTDIDEWLAETIEELEIPDSIAFSSRLESEHTTPIDRTQLRQAVVNLIQNGWQAALEPEAAGDGHPALEVSSRLAGERIEVRVSDTGPGIPEAARHQIFEPLFSTKAFGVGLGLPLVREIMERHGGGVEIDGASGGGTTMVLWLSRG